LRAVVQRVRAASVEVDGTEVGAIGSGLLVYAGVEAGDTDTDVEWTAGKVAGLRVFPDADGKMNLTVADAGGGILLISQFTLLGDLRKGRRPSFAAAEAPERAKELYERLVERLRAAGLTVETGQFQAHMDVTYTNDGPITLLLDSRKGF